MTDHAPSSPLPSEAGLRFIQLFDRFGFVLAFFAGAFGIILLKALQVPQVAVTIFAVAVMVTYAGVIAWSPRLRLREDQAGDNLYYLGLLFTLVSLAWALWVFSPETGAKHVIESFGIALTTTIVGLALRIFFSQMRQNFIEIEQEARLELVDAAKRVRAALDEVVDDMNHFHRTILQSIAEAHTEAAKRVEETAAKAVVSLETITESVTTAIAESFKGLNEHSARFTMVAESIIASMEKHAASMDKLADGTKTLEDQMGALAKIATDAEKGLNNLSKKTTEMRAAQAAMTEAATAAREFIAEQRVMLSDLRTALETFCTGVTRAASAWETEEGEALKRLVAKGSVTQKALEEEMATLHLEQIKALKKLADTLDSAATAAAKHSNTLAGELEKSRTYTTQVHQNLVEMTGQLVNRLERQSPVSASNTFES